MSKNRGDLLGDALIPRKGAVQTSVRPPEIHLPKPVGGRRDKPQEASPLEPERTLGMTFRMSETTLGRLKMCALRTRRTQQQVLADALEQELAKTGF
jgi:hypothetical protein